MARWDLAQQRYEQQTRAWRAARGEREQARSRVQAAAARVELFDVLVGDGWRPDPLVVAQIERDRALVLDVEVAQVAAGAGAAPHRRAAGDAPR